MGNCLSPKLCQCSKAVSLRKLISVRCVNLLPKTLYNFRINRSVVGNADLQLLNYFRLFAKLEGTVNKLNLKRWRIQIPKII